MEPFFITLAFLVGMAAGWWCGFDYASKKYCEGE